jgi:hypothetical protein
MDHRNAVFDGSLPETHDRHPGRVIFAPRADLAARVASAVPDGARVLPIACGTGAVTRELRRRRAPGATAGAPGGAW